MGVHAAAAREVASGKTVAGTYAGHVASSVHGSLPILLQGAKRAGQGRLHENSQWRAGHRAPAKSCVHGRGAWRLVYAESIRSTGVHGAREIVRAFPA